MVPSYKNSKLQKETTKHQNQRQFYDKTAQNTLDGTFCACFKYNTVH